MKCCKCTTAESLTILCLYDSYQPVLWGEERVHVGGFGGGDAAADGAESPPHAAHAYRHPVPHHVSPTGRLRHEHPVPPHRQTGRHQSPAKYSWFLQPLKSRILTSSSSFPL